MSSAPSSGGRRLSTTARRISSVLVVATLTASAVGAAEPAPARRIPWTRSQIQGSPDPPSPYDLAAAFPALKFTKPVSLVPLPGSDRWVVVELGGKLFSFPNRDDAAKADLFFDLIAKVPNLANTYGLAFHPKFAQNRQMFLCYVLQGDKPDHSRVSRFTVRPTDPPTADPASEEILLTFLGGGHNGACLQFGRDGMLYISTGDGTGPNPPDALDTGQDLSDLLSSILRIDVDRPDPGRRYGIPKDNPFLATPKTRPEVWAYGFRNPWQMSFDRATGDLWVGDVGWDQWELVYRVERGGNYGWSVMEGPQPVRPDSRRGPTPILPPVVAHPHHEARSITGGFVYRGNRLPELAGAYIYGDFSTGKLWALRQEAKGPPKVAELADSPLQIVAFGEDHAGELIVVDFETTGRLYRLIPRPAQAATAPFPRRLSQTGLFADVARQTPSPGVIGYSVIADYWNDGATAERWLALPGEQKLTFDERGKCTFPSGAVLVRTVSTSPGDNPSATKRRVETQLLHFESGAWRPYSYAWNEAQTDAELVPAEGAEKTLGGSMERYRIASRAECNLCHSAALDSVLGVHLLQLNRPHPFDDGPQNQLRGWAKLGLLQGELPKNLDERPRLVDPSDAVAPMEKRARSYLHANCQHCHRIQGAGTATIILDFEQTLDQTMTINAIPAQGTFGLPDARIIAPGDPYRSVLFFRTAKLGRGRMPHLGSAEIDDAGVALLEAWIRSLRAGPTRGVEPDADSSLADLSVGGVDDAKRAKIERLLAEPATSLRLSRWITSNPVSPALKEEILRQAGRSKDSLVREVFERFLPKGERTKRLGDRVEPKQILSLQGDVERGRRLFFFSDGSQCKSCHVILGVGGAVGPDLSQVGKRLDKAKLVESLLNPSKQVEPRYQSVAVAAKGGSIWIGVVEARTPEKISLRDAKGKITEIPLSDVETLTPQAKSLMPDGLLRDMTAQEAADLVEYLSSLR